jgi:SAM-dependent methyltransferase
MSDQNIFDNEHFFQGYKKIRKNPLSANELVEKPALFSLCPDLMGKTVLDLGCGYGENCQIFSKMGAKKVIGVDVSKKMIEVASRENSFDNVIYLNMSMSNLSSIEEKFDVVISSLAVHYIQDFGKLLFEIQDLLNEGGSFIFSQEHPLTTALTTNNFWSKDENGDILHYNLTDYSLEGERKTKWIVDDVIKYHRTFSSIINSLVTNGFIVEKIIEPIPDKAIIEKHPNYRRYYHKPDFLFIGSRKQHL